MGQVFGAVVGAEQEVRVAALRQRQPVERRCEGDLLPADGGKLERVVPVEVAFVQISENFGDGDVVDADHGHALFAVGAGAGIVQRDQIAVTVERRGEVILDREIRFGSGQRAQVFRPRLVFEQLLEPGDQRRRIVLVEIGQQEVGQQVAGVLSDAFAGGIDAVVDPFAGRNPADGDFAHAAARRQQQQRQRGKDEQPE